MNYLIAVLPDRTQAEAAYAALEAGGLPKAKVSILGKGYQSADEFGLVDPQQERQGLARLMAFWLVPFGFLGGFAFNVATGFDLFDWAGTWGNRLLGGLLGAIGGAMGSFFVGGGTGIVAGGKTAPPYRKSLKEGKYLIVVNAPANMTNTATRILRQFKPEAVQNYAVPILK